MESFDQEIQYAIEHTEVLRPPRQKLATFGITQIYYYLVTDPIYREALGSTKETVVREGKVIAERPRIVTPFYLLNLFEGFEHGKHYAEYILRQYGPHEPGLLYRYKNEPSEINIVSGEREEIVHKLNEEINRGGNDLATIIKGVDELWDICLMKFIHDLTRSSLPSNVIEMERRGLLKIDHQGVPREARERIEGLFAQAKAGEIEPAELKIELDRWGIFDEYEDRFLALFRKR